jgi:hypothetical protein
MRLARPLAHGSRSPYVYDRNARLNVTAVGGDVVPYVTTPAGIVATKTVQKGAGGAED